MPLKDHRDVLSAWNWRKGRYDYYRPPFWARKPYGDTTPSRPAGMSGQLGAAPEDSAGSMPLGAIPMGSGDEARGQIVQHPWEGGAMLQQYLLPAGAGAAAGYVMTKAKGKKNKGALYGAGGGVLAYLVAGWLRGAFGMAPAAGATSWFTGAAAGGVGALSVLHFFKP